MTLQKIDKAYKEHNHSVSFVDSKVKTLGFEPPSSLQTINECEYMTYFKNIVKGVVLCIVTKIEGGYSCIILCAPKEEHFNPSEGLSGIPGKKFRLKDISETPEGFAEREKSLTGALVKLGIIPEENPGKKLIEDAVKVRNGERVLDYSQFKKRDYTEEYSLDYNTMGFKKKDPLFAEIEIEDIIFEGGE